MAAYLSGNNSVHAYIIRWQPRTRQLMPLHVQRKHVCSASSQAMHLLRKYCIDFCHRCRRPVGFNDFPDGIIPLIAQAVPFIQRCAPSHCCTAHTHITYNHYLCLKANRPAGTLMA